MRPPSTMERWRSFFGRSGEDLWTIIEQAINLAATDYPQDFKANRCDIAELLFARPPPGSVIGENEAPRLSASAITNVTTTHATPLDMDEVRDDERCLLHEPRHNKHEPSPPLLVADVGHEAMMTGEVEKLKETLTNADQSEIVILNALQRLESLQISVEVLKATEVGKHVSQLRKHVSKRVRLSAKGLVRLWKELVDEWANANQGVALDALASGAFADKDGPSSSLQEEGSWQMRCLPRECSEHDTKMRHNEEIEVPDVMGSSSRAEHAVLGTSKVPTKGVFDGEAEHTRPLPLNMSSLGGSGPGRPPIDISKGNTGQGKSATAMKGKTVNIFTGKRPAQVDEVQHSNKFKLDAAKHKLHECYSQAENGMLFCCCLCLCGSRISSYLATVVFSVKKQDRDGGPNLNWSASSKQ